MTLQVIAERQVALRRLRVAAQPYLADFLSQAVELALPESHTSAPSEERSIRVAVDADGVVYLDDEPIALAALEPAIAAALGVDPDATVSLSTDAELRVQQMLAVIDEIRAAGAERLSFVAQGVGEAPGAGATD